MAATAQPNIGTKEGFAAGDNGWVGDYNFLNRAVDGLVQASVKAIQAAPPGSPARGDCYIVATSGTGAWAGWDGRFTRYTGSAWESWIPKVGWYVFNQEGSTPYRYKSGAWVVDDFLSKNNPTFTGTMTGPTLVAGTLISPTLFAAEQAGASAVVAWGTGAGAAASMRWKLLKEGTAELGSNVGSDLVLNSYSDSGAFIEAVLRAPRAAGSTVTIYRPLKLASSLSGTGTRPVVALSDGTIDDQDASTFRSTIGAAPSPSRATISASTSLGGISASAIYIPTTDVNLTLDGGVDGQAWDIYSAASVGLIVPSGTSLYAYNGIDTGPTTRPVGGGRAIRVVRLTATTWLVPNMSW